MDATLKIVFSVIALGIALIPAWIYWFVHSLLQPQGFWQNLILLGAGVWVLGTLQIIFLVVWFAALIAIWETR